MNDQTLYPWQSTQWQSLLKQHAEQRLPHALLLVGSRGLGKADFTRAFADYLLCLQPSGQAACGMCKSCELNNVDTHPDLKWIAPEEEGKQIKIADIRDVGEFAAQTAQQGGYRVVVIAPAEAMNSSSANALLKNLEEPGRQTIFLLVSHVPGRLSATVRSRCQKVIFAEPDLSVGLQWLSAVVPDETKATAVLNLAHGAPLAARDLFEIGALEQYLDMCTSLAAVGAEQVSTVEVAKKWSDWNVSMLLEWMAQLLAEGVKQALGDNRPTQHKELAQINQQLSRVAPHLLYDFMDKVHQARQLSLSTANPNKQLLVEDLLVSWIALLKH